MFLISNSSINNVSEARYCTAFKSNPVQNTPPKDTFESSNKPLQCENLRSEKEVKQYVKKILKDSRKAGYSGLNVAYWIDRNYRKMVNKLASITYIDEQGKPQGIPMILETLYYYRYILNKKIDIEKHCKDLQNICNIKVKRNGIEFSLFEKDDAMNIEMENIKNGTDIDSYLKKIQATANLPDFKKLIELKEEDEFGNIKYKFSGAKIADLAFDKMYSGQSWDWYLKTPEEQNEIIAQISKLNTEVPTEKICDFLNNKSTFPNDLIPHFEKINEILYGTKPKELQEISDDFKKKTGINLKFDNNLDPQRIKKDLIPTLEKFAKVNKEKGYHNPNNICITNMLGNAGGFFDEYYDGFAIRPYYNNLAGFYSTLHHENAHNMHWLKLKYPTNIEGDPIPDEYMKYVKQSALGEYAQTNTLEFVACLFEAVEGEDKENCGDFCVTQNEKGETVLRMYSNEKLSRKKLEEKQKAIEKVAELYVKLKGPKITPAEDTHEKAQFVEAKFYD